jgi:ketosteroid isomerase-like protein
MLVIVALCNSAHAFESPQALQDAFMAAMRANDSNGLAACYTADATNYPPDLMSGTGPESVRASWGEFFRQYRVLSAETSDGRMEISGDLAAAWGLFTLTVEPVAGGEPVVMKGRYMDVARNFDGNWLYVADHASMPLPAPAQ